MCRQMQVYKGVRMSAICSVSRSCAEMWAVRARSCVVLVTTALVVLTAWVPCAAPETSPARILAVLPTNVRSHYTMYGRILEALARRNHSLTIITHFPMKNPPANVKEINLAGTIPVITNNITQHQSLKPEFVINLERIINECVEACEAVSKVEAVKSLLNSSLTFDLVIVEVFGSECVLPFGNRFDAPVVGMLSSVILPWVNNQIGNPEATAYVPAYMMGFGQRMNLWERIANTFSVIWAKIMYKYKSQIPSQVIADRIFGPGHILESLAQNYSLILANSHFSINEVRPLVPALIEVGGLHLDDTQKIPEELKRVLDASHEGVVYWSFGSMSKIETIPSEKLTRILTVLGELPCTVLIKMDRNNLSENVTVPDNVYTMQWAPQYPTLCHQNVKLFITHGGLLGTQEAVACAVPMLTVPLYADQALNAHAMYDRGVAITASLGQSEDTWRKNIHELLENQKYKENARKLREIFLDRPLPPLDMGVYWIEYILKHKGAKHLRSPALDMSEIQRVLLDVISIGATLALLTFYLLYKLFRYLSTRCIKWWPKEEQVFEKKLFRKKSLLLCLFYKYKVKTK